MDWDAKHPCPSCGKEHEEREMLNKCTNCGQIYCGDYRCSGQGQCPRCGNSGVVPVAWDPINRRRG